MSKKLSALLVAVFLSLMPLVNAQNVHGWQWGISVGDEKEFEMSMSYGVISDSKNILVNVTSLSDLSTVSEVSEIEVTYNITDTDHNPLDSLRSEAISTFFGTPVALPIGNWTAIEEDAPHLIGEYFEYLLPLVNSTVINNSTHFGMNIGYDDNTVLLSLNATWDKSDGFLSYYNLSFSSELVTVHIALVEVPPPEPSPVDSVLAFVQENLILVIGVVVALCIIAGIANRK